ncbi:PRC and DUF2382 domain-containing protein [Kitasatospora sp. NBC_01287]|uniref:PRC and DUF2382 domain-containing protein n=1 Tax=Kitasatospora sp. NBC_01287 TaxID=2903573 RepID=UPI002253F192|nr:PRC and DUF2382 domain-containing protein [Kitasatospora sp. NBC_01287]MCX4750777.1 PRC and DUF2382 domain-containing protein [Kitasatospora sp. NBC_01287]
MQTDIDPRDLIGHKAVDRNGDKIGTVDEVYLDDATGEPEWAAVRTGIFGRDAFVPLTTSEFSGEELRVPYDKSLIKESPDFGVGQHLSPAQELQLYRYYGLDSPNNGRPTERSGAPANGSGAAQDLDFGIGSGSGPGAPMAAAAAASTSAARSGGTTAGPATQLTAQPTAAPTTIGLDKPIDPHPAPVPPPTPDPVHAPQKAGAAHAPATSPPPGPIELTLREERLEITNEWHVLGTARLRKYVVTEPVERRVQVVRERVRVERVPVSEAEQAALTAQEIAEGVEEVTLREERPAVRKYVAPLERVRLVVERYTEEKVIREELRREQVEIHDSTSPDAAGPTPPSRPAMPPEHGGREH